MRIFYYKKGDLSRAFRIFIQKASKFLKILKELFSKSSLSGARTLACGKLQLCLVGLRLHFPSENRQSCTEPRTNARPSGLATPLQNREAPLLDFGQSQYFPNVGKYCALSPPRPKGAPSNAPDKKKISASGGKLPFIFREAKTIIRALRDDHSRAA